MMKANDNKLILSTHDGVPAPHGSKFTKPERALWQKITASKSTWTHPQLMQVRDLIELYSENDKITAQIDDEGMTINNSAGTIITHPLVAVRSRNRNQIRSIFTQLNLKPTAQEKNKKAPKALSM